MFKKIVLSFLKDVILDEAEEKFVKFLSKMFNSNRVDYFTKINNFVNPIVNKVQEIHEYITPLLEEAKEKMQTSDTKYLDELLNFINKEFGNLKINGKDYELSISKNDLIKCINKFMYCGKIS